ncbi:hypothetical protein D9757_010363 [Collybiopsis confluens]|uniref:Uncharacterized protein n=1 Tax=Collybiopsis confluens TaxID=2823264 RepID=A0A8H5LVX2_9AGAR|nr:hypothetical protein D9757_010363 [Collybiopsis confluens]
MSLRLRLLRLSSPSPLPFPPTLASIVIVGVSGIVDVVHYPHLLCLSRIKVDTRGGTDVEDSDVETSLCLRFRKQRRSSLFAACSAFANSSTERPSPWSYHRYDEHLLI